MTWQARCEGCGRPFTGDAAGGPPSRCGACLEPTSGEWNAVASGELAMLTLLLPHLTPGGLVSARAWLRHPGTFADVRPLLVTTGADVLSQVCARLVAAGVGSVDYFVGVGDLHPDAPDDLSELDTLEGGAL